MRQDQYLALEIEQMKERYTLHVLLFLLTFIFIPNYYSKYTKFSIKMQ